MKKKIIGMSLCLLFVLSPICINASAIKIVNNNENKSVENNFSPLSVIHLTLGGSFLGRLLIGVEGTDNSAEYIILPNIKCDHDSIGAHYGRNSFSKVYQLYPRAEYSVIHFNSAQLWYRDKHLDTIYFVIFIFHNIVIPIPTPVPM